jgi:5-methylcytosine-specific restriction endonuclease McrA
MVSLPKNKKNWIDRDEDRYGENHKLICRLTHAATDSYCCLCHKKSDGQNEAHHAMYRDRFGEIRDRELPGIHIFSLCPRCHLLAHDRLEGVKSNNWVKDRKDKSYNRNSAEFLQTLRNGFNRNNRRSDRG